MQNRWLIGLVVGCWGLWGMATQTWAHGESVRGSGGATINTTGAEISDGMSMSVRYDRRVYEQFSDQELLGFRPEDVHQHKREESLFVSYTIGFKDNWELSLQLPFNRFTGFKDNGDAFAVANKTLSKTDVSEGVGDLLLLGKYRFWQNEDHHLATLAGIKLPTGNTRKKTNNGAIVGTHNQPGSGSTDFQLGVAYTGHLFNERLGISSDVIGRINAEGAGEFRSGNALQVDVALAFRPHGSLVPLVEFNSIFQARDIEENAVKKNSGVSSLFISPGIRWTVWKRHTVFATVSFPLWQDLPGIQNEEDCRLGVGYGISF